MTPWIALPFSVLLVGWAYSYAATHGDTQTQFTIFWIGIAAFVLPAGFRIFAGASHREGQWLVVALALLFSVPKFLRNPDLPLFHDEFAHWRQVEEILRTHHLLRTNYTIYIIGDYPGLHALTAALTYVTGLSVWRAGQLVTLVLGHVALLLGVFEIGRRTVKNSARAGGVAALVYATNPSYMFFDVQFAYESLAIVFFAWLVVMAIRLSDPDEPAPRACLAMGILLGGAIVMTHHVTTAASLLVLVAATGLAVWRVRGTDASRVAGVRLAVLTAAMVAFTAAWTIFVAPGVIGYLLRPSTQGFAQLTDLVQHKGTSSRGVFGQSPLPIYEQQAGRVAVLIVALLVARGMWLAYKSRDRRLPGLTPLFAVMGLAYVASLPLVLTNGGVEAAHRSWGFSFLGVAVLTGIAFADLSERVRQQAARRRVAWLATAVALGALMVVLVGDVAASENEAYRFPGPFIWGSVTRSTNAEVVNLALAFRRRYGVLRKVVADSYSELSFGAYADAETSENSSGFPAWQLYYTVHTPTKLLQELEGGHWQFAVVDRRMPYVQSQLQVYVDGGPQRRPTVQDLAKFGHVPWMRLVMQSNNFDVYKFDFAALHTAVAK